MSGKQVSILVLVFTLHARSVWGEAETEDVVFLKSGEALKGSLIELDHQRESVYFKVVLDGPNGRGEAERVLSLEEVEFIEFGKDDLESRLDRGQEEPSIELLRLLWRRHHPYVHLEKSPAGDYGLRLAERLLGAPIRASMREVKAIAEVIWRNDWDQHRRQRARCFHLRALIGMGEVSSARKQASVLLAQGSEPELQVEARLILGEAAFESMRQLEEDHPRWREDEEVSAHWESHYHEAFDHFLFASLFHGAMRLKAVEGLQRAIALHRHIEDAAEVRRLVDDLRALYPSFEGAESKGRDESLVRPSGAVGAGETSS